MGEVIWSVKRGTGREWGEVIWSVKRGTGREWGVQVESGGGYLVS